MNPTCPRVAPALRGLAPAGWAGPVLTIMCVHGVLRPHGCSLGPHTPVHAGRSLRHASHQPSGWLLSQVGAGCGHRHCCPRGGLRHGLKVMAEQKAVLFWWENKKHIIKPGSFSSLSDAFLHRCVYFYRFIGIFPLLSGIPLPGPSGGDIERTEIPYVASQLGSNHVPLGRIWKEPQTMAEHLLLGKGPVMVP